MKQFSFIISGQFKQSNNDYTSLLGISNNYISQTVFQSPIKNTNNGINISFEKFIKPINLKIKATNGYYIYNYNNILNNNEVRTNQFRTHSNSISLISMFNFPINIENYTSFTVKKFTVNNYKTNSQTKTTSIEKK